mmetsp:Transcript_14799/g.17815  ORF Transcript_14799/g.17815 Transcript_14799/m.17815 type:complete len:133 (-) Transcript_14799:112-510(-)|eukprot:CAMPEP_0195250282 /NCGR_PEP_ID=MMETSP0706-20130129/2606_1 /TAXON_ID=33640 /ORGANISM="Asterionellopsis glacialis, Strain CCMP134" /LENGTH=132 /DNA_ID=CAMNT_0040302221 /DNA_START=86 /DNA_END=484 /DNA_ORIENTATION=+
MPEVNMLTEFFLMWDAEKPHTWEEMEPVANKLLHEEFKMATDTDTLRKPCFMNCLRNMLKDGEVLELIKIEKLDNKVEYEYKVHRRCGKVIQLKAIGIFRDEKLYHVQAVNSAEYDAVFTKELKMRPTLTAQ